MSAPSVTEIRIEGFKSLAADTRLEIRPLTILAGANSSGKSSAIQPLLLLKQTLASPSTPDVLEIAGPNAVFTKYEQLMFSGMPGAREMTFGMGWRTSRSESNVTICYALSDGKLVLKSQFSKLTDHRPKGPASHQSLRLKLDQEMRDLREMLPREEVQALTAAGLKLKTVIERGFLSIAGVRELPAGPRFAVQVADPANALRMQLLNLIHVPGLRGNPQRDYPLRKDRGPRFDGHFQDYVAGIVANLPKDERRELGDSLRRLGLTWKVEASPLDATRVEVVVGRLREPRQGGARDVVNIADVGFGVSQVLPVIVALQIAKPGQLVYLEQPEIHLHPRAQRSLAAVLAAAAARGAVLLVETHSSILLREVQTLVARGELDPSLVKLHWFRRDERNGATALDSADLDENGSFGGEWPEDFDDTYLASERDYLDAVERRMTSK